MLKNQKGVATLMVTLCIALIISLGVYSANKSSLSTIKIANNNYWIKQGSEIAQAGSATTAELLKTNIEWEPSSDTESEITFKTTEEMLQEYEVESILTYSLSNQVATISTKAKKQDGLTAFAEEKVFKPYYLSPLFKNDPLVIQKRVKSISGTLSVGMNKKGVSLSIASVKDDLPKTGLDLKGRTTEHAFSDAWKYVFGMSKEYAKNLSSNSEKSGVYWYDGASPAPSEWTKSVGVGDNPEIVILAKGAGCPVFRDGLEIKGILYIEEDCPTLELNGLIVTGSLVIAGNVESLKINTAVKEKEFKESDFKLMLPPVSIIGSKKVS